MHETPSATYLQGRQQLGTPRSELTRLQNEQGERDPEVREEILEAMLLCAGEVGYRQVAVGNVYRRYGGYRSQFYKHFGSKSECFVAAYDSRANRLADEFVPMIEGEGSGEDRLRAALEALGEFITAEPEIARAIFVEVHVAGEDARLKRQEVVERLSYALDRACREIKSRHSPPPITAEFMICAIDQAVSSAILERQPENFLEAIPDLSTLVCRAYVS
jgi:AcrR family transcriptional regulator